MTTFSDSWLLLVFSLPSNSATARTRIWRALQQLGSGALRDGVYLLPDSHEHQLEFKRLSEEIIQEGGQAWLLNANTQTAQENDIYRQLFDRTQDWMACRTHWDHARQAMNQLSPQELTRLVRKLRREHDALQGIDYFPNDVTAKAEAAWLDFVHIADSVLSPGEPQPVPANIALLDRLDFQRQTWATRAHLWVDRVASAWLISRFIDQDPQFLWLETPEACPDDAYGFDFNGAQFTHAGDRVTFEVLVASFGLQNDKGLTRMGAMVHSLDLSKGLVPEAAGFEAMLAGARLRAKNDDQFLLEISPVLDFLYTHFSTDYKTSQE